MTGAVRLIRQRGQVGKQYATERAHEELTGQFKPFWLIAVELYDRFPTQGQVRDEIERRFGVAISPKTASLWINRGMEERRQAAEAVA